MTSKGKFDATDPSVQSLLSHFQAINLSSTKANETVRNPKSANSLKEIIDRNNLTGANLEEKQSNLVLQLALQGLKLDTVQQDYIVKYVTDGKLKSGDQIGGAYYFDMSMMQLCLIHGIIVAISYLEKHPLPVDEKDFESHCGVGTKLAYFASCF